MIAIPVEYNADDLLVPSKLFGNAKLFALYCPQYRYAGVMANTQSGNGIATADYLLKNGVTKALYSLLGDGPFGTLLKGGSEIFYMGTSPHSLDEVIGALKAERLTRVTHDNAKEYLDPGTASDACECGCRHE